MTDLLKLLNLFSAETNAIPASKYIFDKSFTGVEELECHHYCRVCTTYLGMAESLEETLTCVLCSSSTTVKNSLQDGHYFINLPLKDRLKDILENQGMHDVCSVDRSRHVINDICDGTVYQTLKSRTVDDFLTLHLIVMASQSLNHPNSVFGQYCVHQ